MKKEAYDGNIATYTTEYTGAGVMDIHSNMQGKKVKIKMYKSSAGYGGQLNFLNSTGGVISQISLNYGNWYDSIYTIPANAVRMYITCNGGYMNVYELEPVI